MTLKEKLENLVLNEPKDVKKIEAICREIMTIDIPKESLVDLFKVLEKNPHFFFGMPGDPVLTIERYYKEPYYYDLLIQSIKRYPTEYNLWMLQRLMNTFETKDEKEEGLQLFKKILQETEDAELKKTLEGFIAVH
ncbi:MAG: hypothetical protein LBD45_05000 [Bacteroidales bacterium]|nr:hypothetical protein [Bacteroidales bacterium]